MLTIVVFSLLVLLAFALAGLVYLWREREGALRELLAARTEAATLKAAIEAQQNTRQEMSDSFKGLAATAFESSMGQFLTLAQSTFERAQELHKLDSDQRHKAMDALIKPVSDAWSAIRRRSGCSKKNVSARSKPSIAS
ncbi:MAG: hypothetical protein HC902_11225 [Calothrix sp. SM1_5_4]|nr:hypothetical protein [Calothrix sp. SM1_5_4]